MKDIIRIFGKILILGLFLFIAKSASAQVNKSFIYGKVFASDGTFFEGYINMDKKSFLWSDLYNLQKIENPYSEYIPKNKRSLRNRRLEDEFGNVRIINRNNRRAIVHSFSVRFAYIKSIEYTGRKGVTLELKDDKFINLESSLSHRNNFIGLTDREFGEIRLRLSEINRIVFMNKPAEVNISRAEPIYGRVIAKQGEFTGFVCWDNDEVDLDDLLDGDWESKDVSILFKNIKSIVKDGRCCRVTTFSGREIRLCASNDVNSGNRGVFVNMPNVGRVKVKWSDFESAHFSKQTDDVGLSYDDYKPASRLKAKITLKNDEAHSGVLVYDLDEAMDVEILNGKNGGASYQIPFMYVKSITPRGFDYSDVLLRNGAKISLGDSSDVDYKNSGVLLFTGGENTEFFYWHELKTIVFE